MRPTWVVAADEAVVRMLERPPDGGDLMSVEEIANPDAHAKESELHRGQHGRRSGSGSGPGTQATVSAGDSERHQQAQAFAARVAQRLAEYHRGGRFQVLHLVAAPRMLGYLRAALTPQVAGTVADSLDKDVVQESNAALTRRLFGKGSK